MDKCHKQLNRAKEIAGYIAPDYPGRLSKPLETLFQDAELVVEFFGQLVAKACKELLDGLHLVFPSG